MMISTVSLLLRGVFRATRHPLTLVPMQRFAVVPADINDNAVRRIEALGIHMVRFVDRPSGVCFKGLDALWKSGAVTARNAARNLICGLGPQRGYLFPSQTSSTSGKSARRTLAGVRVTKMRIPQAATAPNKSGTSHQPR